MYAAKAFAVKKIIRELLVEEFFQEVPVPFEGDIDFDNWAVNMEREISKLSSLHKDIGYQIQQRDGVLKNISSKNAGQ